MHQGTAHSRHLLLLTLLPTLVLLPFLGKAFHMDDTVFLWCAQHILRDPLDFYGFTANWYESPYPMYVINQNPPFIAYYIAVVGGLFGWSEWIMHSAFLLPAIAIALGTYTVSRHFCSSPLAATLLGLVTPAFIVSSTNVMAEVTMAAFYIWAAASWLHGLETGSKRYLALSALLISLSAMTKYFGITMAPVLFVYTLLQRQKPAGWYFFLLIPLGVAAMYQWLTLTLYGTNLIAQAMQYSVEHGVDGGASKARRAATGLSFLGGCMLSTLLLTPWLWGARGTLLAVGAVLGVSALLLLNSGLQESFVQFPAQPLWPVLLQYALFVVLGLQILALALADLVNTRDSKSVMLALWLFGTLAFASLVNWSTNARTLLPLMPVVGMLVVRRLEYRQLPVTVKAPWYVLAVVPVALISLLLAAADSHWANNQQRAAQQIATELRNYPHRVWFNGHWGFQWYMEKYGALPLANDSPVQPGDIIIKAENNSNLIALNERDFHLVEEKRLPTCCAVRTMSTRSRAGFYSDYAGELPFSFSAAETDNFRIYVAGRFASEDEARAYYQYGKTTP